MRIKAVFGVVSVALVAVLVGCGGSSDETTSDAKGGSGDKAEVEKLLEDTFGPNPKASSGLLSGTIKVDVEGVPRFKQPVTLSMSGPFRQDKGDDEPKANLSLGIELRNGILGGDLLLVGDDALIGLGSTGYSIPAAISDRIRKPLRNSDNALGSVLNVFGIAPRRWAKNPKIVGNEDVAGVDTIHGTADVDAEQVFLDLAKATRLLTSLRITDITGLPREIGPGVRAALVRSVKTAKGDVYTGAEDKVMRKATLVMTLKPSAADRKKLGGISSLKVEAELTVTDVGAAQKIDAPTARGSYDALQLSLDALAESVR